MGVAYETLEELFGLLPIQKRMDIRKAIFQELATTIHERTIRGISVYIPGRRPLLWKLQTTTLLMQFSEQ